MKNTIQIMTLMMCIILFSCTQKDKISDEQIFTYNLSVVTSVYTYPKVTSENPYVVDKIETFENYTPTQIRMMINELNGKDTTEMSSANGERYGIKIQIINCEIIDSIK